jgi:hypothetical protein
MSDKLQFVDCFRWIIIHRPDKAVVRGFDKLKFAGLPDRTLLVDKGRMRA